MSFFKVIVTKDAGYAADSDAIHIHHARIAEVVNLWCNPATVGELLEIV